MVGRLPLTGGVTPSSLGRHCQEATLATASPRMTILLVDDDPQVLEVVTTMAVLRAALAGLTA